MLRRWFCWLAPVLVLLAAYTAFAGATRAAASPEYDVNSPAQKLLSIGSTLTARRAAIAPGVARVRVERALQSLDWALADVHWTARGYLVDGLSGTNALRDIRTTIGRLTWIPDRAAYESDVAALAAVVGDIAHRRYDEVKLFMTGEGGATCCAPDVRVEFGQRLAASAHDLRFADAATDRVHAALAYARVRQRLAGLPPCCAAASSPTLIGDDAGGPTSGPNPAGLAEAYRHTALATGTVAKIRIYVGGNPPASIVAGIYADADGHPGTLLAQGQLARPTADAWNIVPLAPGAPIVTQRRYWIAFLAPERAGAVSFNSLCCGIGLPTERSLEQHLVELPATWKTGETSFDGPIAAYGLG